MKEKLALEIRPTESGWYLIPKHKKGGKWEPIKGHDNKVIKVIVHNDIRVDIMNRIANTLIELTLDEIMDLEF